MGFRDRSRSVAVCWKTLFRSFRVDRVRLARHYFPGDSEDELGRIPVF